MLRVGFNKICWLKYVCQRLKDINEFDNFSTAIIVTIWHVIQQNFKLLLTNVFATKFCKRFLLAISWKLNEWKKLKSWCCIFLFNAVHCSTFTLYCLTSQESYNTNWQCIMHICPFSWFNMVYHDLLCAFHNYCRKLSYL